MSNSEKKSRRRFLRKSADVGMFALLASTFSGAAFGRTDGPTLGGKDGSISMMKGTVLVNGVAAKQNTLIPPTAEVKTGKHSLVAFNAGGDAHVLKPNTSIQLSGSGGFTDQFRLLTGALMSAWGTRPAGRQATFTSGTATIGIRGTVTFCAGENFALMEGAVSFSYKDASGNNVTVPLSRDQGGTGSLVTVNTQGQVIAWVPPVSSSELTALVAAVQAAAAADSSGAAAAGAAAAGSTGLGAMESILAQVQQTVEAAQQSAGIDPNNPVDQGAKVLDVPIDQANDFHAGGGLDGGAGAAGDLGGAGGVILNGGGSASP